MLATVSRAMKVQRPEGGGTGERGIRKRCHGGSKPWKSGVGERLGGREVVLPSMLLKEALDVMFSRETS